MTVVPRSGSVEPLRVLIDAQVFRLQRRGGISRYFVELLRQYEDPALSIRALTPYRVVRNQHLVDAFPLRFRVVPTIADRGANALGRSNVLRKKVIRLIGNYMGSRSEGSPDLIHHTYYLPAESSRGAPPRVCTVYDMIPEIYPELFPEGNPHQAKQQYVQECAGLICISETTRRDMERIYGRLDKPVQVIHLGVGEAFSKANGLPSRLPWPYLLFVGQRDGYKNGALLLKAWSGIAQSNRTIRLVLVGGGALTSAEQEIINNGVGADRIVMLSASDDELPILYAGAEAFVFPSRYEGFGLPVLEGFAAGTPVLLADNACLQEVGGEAAQYFSPESSDALTELVLQTLNDERSASHFRLRGRHRAAMFTWQATARRTALFYRDVLGTRP